MFLVFLKTWFLFQDLHFWVFSLIYQIRASLYRMNMKLLVMVHCLKVFTTLICKMTLLIIILCMSSLKRYVVNKEVSSSSLHIGQDIESVNPLLAWNSLVGNLPFRTRQIRVFSLWLNYLFNPWFLSIIFYMRYQNTKLRVVKTSG